jgi:lysozyme family protein
MSGIYPTRFMSSVGLLIERIEGGDVNDANDPGGETKYGISKRSYPNVDIGALTEATAIQIYYSDFWLPCGASSLPRGLDLWVFDGAVNHGVATSVKILQDVCGVGVDGVFGPVTAAAAQKLSEPELYLCARMKYYQSLPGWLTYQKGWIKRLFIVARGA